MKIQSISQNINFKATTTDNKTNNNEFWSRNRCNTGGIMLTTVIVDALASGKIAKAIIKKQLAKNPNYLNEKPLSHLKIQGHLGVAILALGGVASYLFNKYDEQFPDNKVGSFLYKLINGPKADIAKL